MKPPVDRSRFDPEIVREVGRLDLVADMLANGLLTGMRRSRRHGFSIEFSEYKPYVPGDDLRFLDWRVYARSERLFVRRFEAETDLEVLLLLDATASMAWEWDEAVTKLQYAANLMAAIACVATRSHDRVGLLVHDAADLHHLPPRCRRDQLERIFGILEGLTPGSGDTLPGLVEAVASARRHRGALIVCTDLEENEDEIAGALEMLSGTEDRVYLLHILDRAEEDLPFERLTHLEDAESGERIPADLAVLRRGHGRTVSRFRERWRAQCERWGIGYRPVHTGMNYLDVLLGMATDEHR